MWLCKIIGHKFREAPLKMWLDARIKYKCIRPGCDKTAKTLEETWWVNRNKKTDIATLLSIKFEEAQQKLKKDLEESTYE